jgi:hypothetical protein
MYSNNNIDSLGGDNTQLGIRNLENLVLDEIDSIKVKSLQDQTIEIEKEFT